MVADYTSLSGGKPERLPSAELVSRWQRLLPGSDATQSGAEERSATCTTAVRAYHRIVSSDGAATWTVAGQFVIDLERHGDVWLISGITLRLAHEEGDRAVVEVPTKGVAQGAGGRVAKTPNRT